MSQSKLNHVYDTNQDIIYPKIQESSQEIDKNDNNTQSNNNEFEIHSIHSTTDKLQFKSTNRSNHHQVAANNWRIKYYMNLNLVKEPQHISLQYRSSSLPQQSVNYSQNKKKNEKKNERNNDKSRKSIERKQNTDDSPKKNKKTTSFSSFSSIKTNKSIHIISMTKSQNNTPPRRIESMLKRKHHKKSRLSRIRSRSDGMLSFCANKKSSSIDSIEDDDDNDSIFTMDSINNHHLNDSININIPSIRTIKSSNLTPPGKISKINMRIKHYRPSPNSSLIYQSSRTPPGNRHNHNYINNNNNNNNRKQRKYRSEPPGIYQPKSVSIAIHRSKPLSINKQKVKPRFDVDFNLQNSYQSSSDPLFNNLTNTECLVDDEANFEMD